MSSPPVHPYAADHPHSHHHNTANSPKPPSHRLSLSSPLPHLITLTHAPSLFLGTLHRHERELVINHQQRLAKREANAAIEKHEATFSHPSPTSTSPSASTSTSTSPSQGAQTAPAAPSANASQADAAEWAAIVAARAAATRRSATLDLEKEMAEERRRKVLAEMEAEGRALH